MYLAFERYHFDRRIIATETWQKNQTAKSLIDFNHFNRDFVSQREFREQSGYHGVRRRFTIQELFS
jgi:hypothetical protein